MNLKRWMWAGVGVGLCLAPVNLRAHCDTLDGPVVAAARLALQKQDLTPVLKWVKPEAEPELKAAFDRTLSVRTKGDEARSLADQFFFETVVRVHRQGEGAPYTGLKPAGGSVPPAIRQADQALETGSVDALVKTISGQVAAGVQQRFAEAREKKAHADHTVAAGREFVAAYVEFIHYVERLHDLAASAHHGADVPAHPPAAAGRRHDN